MFTLLICFLLAFNLLFVLPGHTVIGGEKIIYFLSCSLILLFGNNFKSERVVPKHILHLIYGLLCIILFNMVLHGFNLSVISSFLAFSLSSLVFISVYEKATLKTPIKLTVISCALVNCVYSLFQTGFEPGGAMGSAPRLGTLICLAIISFWNVNKWACVGLSLFCIIIKEVTGLGIIVLLFNNVFIYGLSLIGLFFIHEMGLNSLNLRLRVWKDCAVVLKDIKGCGFGVFPYLGKLEQGYDNQVYSSLLKTLFGLGYSFLGWLVALFKSLHIDRYFCAFMLLCLIEYPLEIPKIWLTFIVVLAISLIEKGDHHAE